MILLSRWLQDARARPEENFSLIEETFACAVSYFVNKCECLSNEMQIKMNVLLNI